MTILRYPLHELREALSALSLPSVVEARIEEIHTKVENMVDHEDWAERSRILQDGVWGIQSAVESHADDLVIVEEALERLRGLLVDVRDVCEYGEELVTRLGEVYGLRPPDADAARKMRRILRLIPIRDEFEGA